MSNPLASLKLFACITQEDKVDAILPHLLALENEALANTDWFNSNKKYVGLLLPDFFILYFGQKSPTRDITSDDVKMEFATLGKGYEA